MSGDWRPTTSRRHGFSERSIDGGIDQIPLPNTVGALWLCGKHAIGPDPEAALARVHATTAVCLNEEHELADRYPQYVAWLNQVAPARAIWFPIPDLHAPSLAAATALIDELTGRLHDGQSLLMHCGAGIGRAGTIAAALMLALGTPHDQVLPTLRQHRPMAGPEAGAQLDLLDAFAIRLGANR